MDLEDVEVLEGQAVAGQQARDCVGRSHEQTLGTVDEVNCSGFGVDEASQGVKPCSLAQSSLPSRTEEAPSVSGVEFPAVIVAGVLSFLPKTGESLAKDSAEESARMFVSRLTPRYGVERSSKNPRPRRGRGCGERPEPERPGPRG